MPGLVQVARQEDFINRFQETRSRGCVKAIGRFSAIWVAISFSFTCRRLRVAWIFEHHARVVAAVHSLVGRLESWLNMCGRGRRC